MNYTKIQSMIEDVRRNYEQGNIPEAERLCSDILASLPDSHPVDTEWNRIQHLRAQTLCSVAHNYCRLGKIDDAASVAERALAIALESTNTADAASAYEALARCRRERADFTGSLEYYTIAQQLYNDTGDTAGIARVLNGIGIVYCDGSTDYPMSLESFEQSLALFRSLGVRYWIAQNLGCIANVYYNVGLLEKSLTYLVDYQSLSEEIGSKSGISYSYTTLGAIYMELGYHSKALENFDHALALALEIGDKSKAASALGNMGNLSMVMGEYDKTLEFLKQSLALSEEIGDVGSIAMMLNFIGAFYFFTEDYSQALEYYYRAIAVFNGREMKTSLAISVANVGEVYCSKTYDGYDPAKAEEHIRKAIGIFEEVGKNPYEFYKILADIYRNEGMWEQSDTTYRTYIALEKEVHNDEMKKKTEQLELQKVIAEREKEIAIARAVVDAKMSATTTLLHKVLPPIIADRIINGEKIADYFASVSILFADIVGFTPIAAQMPARDVLAFLNYVFGEFDRICESHGCEKIKTIGDGYMAVAGAPIECPDHAERIARAALEMMGEIQLPEDIRASLPEGAIFSIRIGIHSGSVFGGIVGEKRFVYDIYSDAVNTAARMESHGEPGKIHVSEEFKHAVETQNIASLQFIDRGETDIKGKGLMKTYFLEKIP
ncbi:MAG: adenylate/guanylate cyclase domain-containing protein [Candidatus Kapaibacterium sp.]